MILDNSIENAPDRRNDQGLLLFQNPRALTPLPFGLVRLATFFFVNVAVL